MSEPRTESADTGARVSEVPEEPREARERPEHQESPAPADLVRVVDTPEERVRHPRAVLWMIGCALGVAAVMVLSVVAHGTTAGVTEDVRSFNDLLATILFVPVAVLQGLVTLFAPVAVMIELGVRRLGRQIVESIAAGVVGLLLGVLTTVLVRHLGSDELVRGMSVWERGTGYVLAVPEYAVALTAMLTVAGPATRRRTVRISWNLLFVALLVVLITGQVSLPGVLVALLLGRLAGAAVQYVSGTRSERAYGPDLVEAVRRAGFAPTALTRVRDDDEEVGPVGDKASLALSRAGGNRVYALSSADGVRRDVVVLDGDRQVVGLITRLWRALRLRGIEGRAAISLKAVAERTALLSYAATAAGVRTPRLLGIGETGDSIVLVLEHAAPAVSLRDLADDEVDDDVLAGAWDQLTRAHAAGLTHRALTQDVLLVHRAEDGPHVWVAGWEQGDIASSPLSRRLDLVQMLALVALRVGPRRAVASAVRALPDADIAALGPLIQSIALPWTTREEVRRAKGLLGELRGALVERLPEASVQPQRISRFSARTVLTTTLMIVVVAVVVTTINFTEITQAVRGANPWWIAVAFALAVLTWLGAGLTLVAFSPARVPLGRATLTAAAGSFVALAAPAGIGPAALNLRLLTQRGVSMSMAVATVALVQVSQFVVTVLLLVALSIFTGSGALVELPSPAVLITLAAVALAVVAALLVPPVRRWGMGYVAPRLRQVWPRLAQVMSHPGRLALGVAGNLVMTLGYIVALWCCLAAFQESLSLVDIALVNLVGNALGALIPTPGGLGGVEGALTAGMSAAGVPATIAFSATILYRLCTYWGRVPIGWVAMRYLERKGDL
ncbi:flippase-like domain-containing protein [Promicromonospora citrea]|uniref:Membrane protein n=1 Tax=Promicromonospora citrea TaxID=43677 RepID=A0A8H9L296_9MICO|nr:lysylphosphatidylglycerol synthase transmembrane domain-containing protein [Promicromonospora citrea]NNH53694.1 flippase-like domain-containing protein [Promicromonospora citrea]GGM10454.1 membrane protein [Promicromonospora citrea]